MHQRHMTPDLVCMKHIFVFGSSTVRRKDQCQERNSVSLKQVYKCFCQASIHFHVQNDGFHGQLSDFDCQVCDWQ